MASEATLRLSIDGYADMIRFYRRLMENAAG